MAKIFGCYHSTVGRTIRKYLKTGDVQTKPRGGRKSKLTPRDELKILRLVENDRQISCKKFVGIMKTDLNISVGRETIRRTLAKHGFHSYTPRKVPLISRKNRKSRLAFAKKYLPESLEFWKRII